MHIVIDMQGAQASNRNRGIGRYTLSLSQAIARNRGEHEVILALSGLFPDTIEPIRAAYAGELSLSAVVLEAPFGTMTTATCLGVLAVLAAGLFLLIRPLLDRKLS